MLFVIVADHQVQEVLGHRAPEELAVGGTDNGVDGRLCGERGKTIVRRAGAVLPSRHADCPCLGLAGLPD
jgi:hypothetical protein